MPYKPKYQIIDGKKKCNTCEVIKPINDFYPYKKSIRGSCKKCMNKKSKEYMKTVDKKTRSEWWHRAWKSEDFRKRKYEATKKKD